MLKEETRQPMRAWKKKEKTEDVDELEHEKRADWFERIHKQNS